MANPEKTRYKLIKQVGAGDFAKVYAAKDVKLGRNVAIKQLHSQYMDDEKKLARYWQEAQLLVELEHPNIMTIYDIVKSRGRLVLELMQGSLRQIYGQNPMPVADVRQTIRQAAQGLACLHDNGIIHGDIKPANLMLSRTKVVKLGDFGLARRASDDQGSMLKGTTKYMAPELVSEDFGPVGPQSDLYSLGFTALELMVGPEFDSLFPDLVAFGRDKQMAWMMWHCSADRRLPVKTVLNGVPDDLANVIEKLTSKDQSKRYQTAREVVADLAGSAKPVGESLEEQQAEAEETAKRQKKNKRIKAILAFVSSLIMCGAFLYFMREKPKPVARVAPAPVSGVVMNVLPFDDKFVIETGKGKKEFKVLPNDEIKLNRKSAVLRDLEYEDRLVVNTIITPGKPASQDRYQIIAFRPEQHSGVISEIKPDSGQFVLTVKDGEEFGESFDLSVKEVTEIIVNKEPIDPEAPLTLSDLRKDDEVVVDLCDELDGMVALKVDSIRQVQLEGVIRKLVPRSGTMTIADTSGAEERLVSLRLDAGCTFSLNGIASLNDRLLNASDIKIGDRVKIMHDVKITSIDAYRPFEDQGSIRSIGYQQGNFQLKSRNATSLRSYSIDTKTQVLLGGDIATLDDLREGDDIQLVHDSPDDQSPTLLSLNAMRPTDRNKWAILIGIDQFDSLGPLPGAVANLGVLESSLTKRFGVRTDQVKKFENPTRLTIQQELPNILSRIGDRGELFVYIATQSFVEKEKGAYLATKKFSPEEIETSGLPLDWLIDEIDACSCSKKVLFLDCPATTSLGESGPATATEMVRLLQDTRRGGYPKYTHVLANAQPGDGAVAPVKGKSGDLEQTVFGAAICEAFSGSADRERDLQVQITELTNYVTKRTSKLANSVQGKQTPFLFTPDDRPPRILPDDKQAIIELLTEFAEKEIDPMILIETGRRLKERTNGQPEPMLATGIILIKSFKMNQALVVLEKVRLENQDCLLAHQSVVWLHLYKRQYDLAGTKLQQMLGRIDVPEDGEAHDPVVLKKFEWAGSVRELVGGSSDWNQRVPEESVLTQCDSIVASHGSKAIEMYRAGRAPVLQKIKKFASILEADPGSETMNVRKRVKSYEIQIATPESIREIREALEFD